MENERIEMVINQLKKLVKERDLTLKSIQESNNVFEEFEIKNSDKDELKKDYERISEIIENRVNCYLKELEDRSIYTEEEAIEAENEIYDIVNESQQFVSKNKVKKSPALFVRMDDEKKRGEGFSKDPYIGVYDGPTFAKSKNMVRIGLKTGNLISHNNTDRKSRFGALPANSEQVKMFVDMLINNKKANAGDYKNMELGKAINEYLKKSYDDFEEIDFSKFKINKELRTKEQLRKYNK